MRRLGRCARWLRTVAHLKPQQVYHLLRFRCTRPRPVDRDPPPWRPLEPRTDPSPASEPCLVGPSMLRLLNEEVDLDREGWDLPQRARLLQYHLHYFDDLTASRSPDRLQWQQALMKRWIKENPSADGPGWEPYPLSTRIINWAQWSLWSAPDPEVVRSLANQVRVLTGRLEYHLMGNHLIRNAAALIHGGLRYRGAEAQGWLDTGRRLLMSQLREQVLADGGHHERSPMYQAVVLKDLVNVLTLFDAARLEPPRELPAIAGSMLSWLAAMSHPDGEIGFFNDAAIGLAPTLGQLRGALEGHGVSPPGRSQTERAGDWEWRVLDPSGYVRVDGHGAAAILDLAPLGPDHLPGHGHADTLSFEFSLGNHRVVVNGGTSLYEPGAERLRQRGTAAHSTVTVDDSDSSEVWASFRVGRRARVRDVSIRDTSGGLLVTACHDGYTHLPGRPLHRREWLFQGPSVTIRDAVEGRKEHRSTARYHLAPGIEVRREQGLSLLAAGQRIRVDSPRRLATVGSTYCSGFGVEQSSQCVVIPATGPLPHLMEICLSW